jgi:uncharacterized protein YndB with AHSA1/START domain
MPPRRPSAISEYVAHIDIAAPPRVVFDHLTTVRGLLAWMGDWAELSPQPGGVFAVNIQGAPIRGHFLEVEPPHRVVVSWGMAGSADFPAGTSRLEFRLEPLGAGTRLHMRHSGLPETRADTHARGWTHYLARLRTAGGGADPGPDAGFLR